jgi:type III secretory pathway lipoprotein EscJ
MPPIDAHEVKRVVAGAAPGLAPDDVAVVMVPRPATAAADRALARLGPITATRGSVSLLRMVTAGVVVIHLALVFAVLLLWSRLRRIRALALEPPPLQQARRFGI